ncbi:MAG: Rne/Rng family ribonuclease [Marinilabiliales bacterium]
MNKDLIIDVNSSDISIALLEDKRLVEFVKEKINLKFSVGDIYLGRVKKIIPGLNAAFVDIGYEKDAFLHYFDLGPQFASLQKYLEIALSPKKQLPPLNKFTPLPDIDKHGKISDVLKSGQAILVQIAKEPISTKGPRLSAEISIAGRNLVLLPFNDKVSVSLKVSSQEERDRLKNLLTSIKPEHYGVIVRTAAKSKKVADFDNELKELIEKWENALKTLSNVKPPKLVLSELDRTTAFLRDMLNEDYTNIYVNNTEVYNEIKEYIKSIVPEKEKIVKLYQDPLPIFDEFGVEKQIKSLFGRTVPLKNGAYLVIEHTEALHSIDVNSGNRAKSESNQESTAIEVNLSAAEEIARQLKLRDMGGIIVVDFIDMHKAENKKLLYTKMKEFMATDRAKHHIIPLSKFGLMQITRQRVRPEIQINTVETCPTCHGTGEIASSIVILEEIENMLQYILGKKSLKKIHLQTHPYLAAYINQGGFKSLRKKWQKKYRIKLNVTGIMSFSMLEYRYMDENGEEILF